MVLRGVGGYLSNVIFLLPLIAWGISICCFAITMASLRLPIVYHLILTEPTTKWQDDRSYSLYVAIAVVGMSFGLMLPAEFMLIEICINDRSELQWERGGWVCVAALILPMLVGGEKSDW